MHAKATAVFQTSEIIQARSFIQRTTFDQYLRARGQGW